MSGKHCENESLVDELRAAKARILELETALTKTTPQDSPLHESPDPAGKRGDYLRCLLRSIPDLVWLKDLNGVYLMCNSSFERFYGARESDIVGKTDYDFVDHDLADFFRQNDRKAMESDGPRTNEEWLTFSDTGYRGLFETVKSPMRDAQGNLIGILGIARDITDRKRTEEALEQRMVSLTLPLDNAEGITFEELFNIEDIQRLQDEFAQAMGVASLITRPDGSPITKPSGFCEFCQLIRKTRKGLKNCIKSDIEIGRYSENGPRARPCLSGGLWDAGAGITVGGRHIASWLVGQVRDSTQSETSIRKYAREIGTDEDEAVHAFYDVPAMSKEQFSRVAQVLFTLANQLSTAAYQNVQQARFIYERQQVEKMLIEMKDKAEAANKSKSEFLANMSHEIRTPLNGVLGMLHLLEDTSPTNEQQHLLDAAMTSARRLTRLLSDILDLSKVEAGKLQLVDSRFNIASLRDSILDLFQLAARENGIELNFPPPRALPETLLGDETRLRQILFNLVGNAVKFTQSGLVSVEVKVLARRPDSSVRILFTVRDTGIGITDEQLQLIFEPFIQADGSYTRKFQGAGLGLPIVRKLVHLMGGELAIDNTEGSGTTAYLSLPFHVAHEDNAENPKPDILKRPPSRKLRVLIAEDDQVSMLYGKKTLQRLGHEVITASNGQEALQRLAEKNFDLVLMDIQMPVMNGMETASAIRSSEELGSNARIPIIAMTAYAMAGDKELFLSAGMNGYIAKPMEASELQTALAQVMTASA
jgi:PAS domain S-box-containing protein